MTAGLIVTIGARRRRSSRWYSRYNGLERGGHSGRLRGRSSSRRGWFSERGGGGRREVTYSAASRAGLRSTTSRSDSTSIPGSMTSKSVSTSASGTLRIASQEGHLIRLPASSSRSLSVRPQLQGKVIGMVGHAFNKPLVKNLG